MNKPSPFFVFSLVLMVGFLGPLGCGSFKRFLYEGAGREDWQMPDRVVARTLAISPGDKIADLGIGGRLFHLPIRGCGWRDRAGLRTRCRSIPFVVYRSSVD